MEALKIGDRGTFYPGRGPDGAGESETAEVVHVWSDTCVNLKTKSGAMPTSVFVYRGGAGKPSGYYFEPEAKAAAATPSDRMLRYFAFEHLPTHLQAVSRPIGELARQMAAELPEGPEKTTGLRKLLEAKDCFVRAALDSRDKEGGAQ